MEPAPDLTLMIIDHPEKPGKFIAFIVLTSDLETDELHIDALASETFDNQDDAEPWFAEMVETRPWETRQ